MSKQVPLCGPGDEDSLPHQTARIVDLFLMAAVTGHPTLRGWNPHVYDLTVLEARLPTRL